jgi:hypothetical protein
MLRKVFRKIENVKGRPCLLKKTIIDYSYILIPKAYDQIIIIVDLLISLVCIPLYDVCCAFRKKTTRLVDVQFCSSKYSDQSARLLSVETIALEKNLISYVGDSSKVSICYWDDDRPIVGMGFEFYRRVIALNPKYLILCSYDPDCFFSPAPWILARLKKRNICLVSLWLDTCSSGFISLVSPLIDIIDLHIYGDNPSMDFDDSSEAQKFKEKSLLLLVPVIQIETEERDMVRDIDVVFFGQISSYRDVRRPYIEFLNETFKGSNVNWYCSTSDRGDEWCSHEEHMRTMSRAKIGISFSMSAGRPQFKGRVLDTMFTGGLLLDQRNKQTEGYFTEGEDYAAFSSREELLEKIKYYLANEDERKKIAASGNRKAKKLVNGNVFWGSIFDSLGAKL